MDNTRIPTEHWEQVQLFQWASNYRELDLMHAIPNGGKRDIRVAVKLKEEGVKAGVPDICLPVARGEKHGLYIELKRRKYGRLDSDQAKWLEALMREGYACAVCFGWEAARDVIEDYLRGATDDKAGFSQEKQRKPDAPARAGNGRAAVRRSL